MGGLTNGRVGIIGNACKHGSGRCYEGGNQSNVLNEQGILPGTKMCNLKTVFSVQAIK